jgi:hypothetical protein
MHRGIWYWLRRWAASRTSAAPGWRRLTPDIARHSDGYEVGGGDRFHAEYSEPGRTGRVGVESGGLPGMTIYRDSFVWVDPPDAPVDPAERDVIVARIADGKAFLWDGAEIQVVDNSDVFARPPRLYRRADLPAAGTPEWEAWLRSAPEDVAE